MPEYLGQRPDVLNGQVEGETDKHLRRLFGIRDRLARELFEFWFRQEHRMNVVGMTIEAAVASVNFGLNE